MSLSAKYCKLECISLEPDIGIFKALFKIAITRII